MADPEMAELPQIGVLILAGGEASRLPNKLSLRTGDVPMIVRVYRNVSAGRPTFVSCKGSFPPEIDEQLDCPMVVDRWKRRGPLGGMLSTMEAMPTSLVFAVAGDAPFIDVAFIDRLAREWQSGDEAVVPLHSSGVLEPLAALYDRLTFVREGTIVFTQGDASLRSVVERLRARKVKFDDDRIFTNVNTPADYAAALAWMS